MVIEFSQDSSGDLGLNGTNTRSLKSELSGVAGGTYLNALLGESQNTKILPYEHHKHQQTNKLEAINSAQKR